MKRRLVGGYEWRDRLEHLKRVADQVTSELVEMGKHAPTTEASRRYTTLVALSSQISISALELRDYQAKEHEPTRTTNTTPWWVTADDAA